MIKNIKIKNKSFNNKIKIFLNKINKIRIFKKNKIS